MKIKLASTLVVAIVITFIVIATGIALSELAA